MILLLFFLSIISVAVGLSLIFGFGWALLIIDLLAGNNVSDYHGAQQTYGGSKKYRFIGIALVLIGIVLFVIQLNS